MTTQNQSKPVGVGTELTRVFVELDVKGLLTVSVTQHVITRQFNENGFCIDNTHFKVYKTKGNKIKNPFVYSGYKTESFIVGTEPEEIDECVESSIAIISKRVESSFNEISTLKATLESGIRSYISELDLSPWGVDVNSKK